MATSFSNSCNCSIVVIGVVLTFISSFTEQATFGYYLDSKLLLVGMIPYLLFALAAVLLKGALSMIHGLSLLALHAWVVISARFTGASSDEWLIYGPLLLSLALLPLLYLAMHKTHNQQANIW